MLQIKNEFRMLIHKNNKFKNNKTTKIKQIKILIKL